MIDLEKNDGVKPVHVSMLLQIEYDFNPQTREITNFTQKEVTSGKKNAVKSTKPVKEKVLTDEDIAEGYPIATLTKSALKLNACAARTMGVLLEDGSIQTTVIGNRIRVQITFMMDQENGKLLPILNVDGEEKLINSQQLRDNLSISCSGMNNGILAQYGSIFEIQKINDDQFRMIPHSDLHTLLESLGAFNKDNTAAPEDLAPGMEKNYSDTLKPEDGIPSEEGPQKIEDEVDIPDVSSPEISGVGLEQAEQNETDIDNLGDIENGI